MRVTVGAATDEPRQRILQLSHVPQQPTLHEKVTVAPGELTPVYFKFDPPLQATDDVVVRISLDPEDALPGDDAYWLNLDNPGTTRVLIVEPTGSAQTRRGPSLHLRTALDSLSESAGVSLNMTRRDANNVTVNDIREADVVFLVDVPSLSAEATEALRRQVRAGSGLAIFMGSGAQPNFYNSQLHGSDAENSLLPVTIGSVIDAPRGPQLNEINRQHPLLQGLLDPAYGDVAEARFYHYRKIDVAKDAASQVIARYEDRTPAIIAHSFGSGRVLLLNTTADDDWSDLPRRPGFVPLVDRMFTTLAGGLGRGTFNVGDPVRLPLSEADAQKPVTVKHPDGATQTVGLTRLAGRPALELRPRTRPASIA